MLCTCKSYIMAQSTSSVPVAAVASTASNTTRLSLLLRAKNGKRQGKKSLVSVRKGELLEEVKTMSPANSKEHNYRVYNEPSITLYCDATDVALLVGAEPHYLMAVNHELRPREFFSQERKSYIMELSLEDELLFRPKDTPKFVKGRVRYIGACSVKGKQGVHFCVEIDKDDVYRGKGTTAGLPHFDCGRKNAVWVSMDMVVYTPGQYSPRDNTDASQCSSRDDSKSPVAVHYTPRNSSVSSDQHSLHNSPVAIHRASHNSITSSHSSSSHDQQSLHDDSNSPLVAAVYHTLDSSTDDSCSCSDQHTSPVVVRYASHDSSSIGNQLTHYDDGNSPLVAACHSPHGSDRDSTTSNNSFTSPDHLCDDSNSSPVAVPHSPHDSNDSKASTDEPSSCSNQQLPSNSSPVAVRRVSRIDSTGSSKTKTSHPNRAFKVASKVFDYLMKPEGKLQRSKLYKKGDRVVIYSMKDQRPISATVRWTGAVQMSAHSEVPLVIFAGLEPDTDIDPEVEFPDTHCQCLADNEWAQFDSKKISTKLYIPEQLLISEGRYKKQQRKLEKSRQRKKKQAKIDTITTHITHESESLIDKLSQQAKLEKLTSDLALLQQENIDMKALISEKETALMHTEQRVFQLQDHNAVLDAELQQMIQEASHLNQEKTLLYQENAHLQDKVQQLQSKIEQQPKLGSDLDIGFWLVSHTEVHSSSQLIGKGGWGSVAVGSFRGQTVAVKELYSSIRSPYYNDILRREISLMAKIRHPNLLLFIAAVLDKPGRSDPIIITELLDTDLRTAYQDGKLGNNRVRLFILRDVAAALNYLHLQREPIIHRDVSSANVLLQALPDNKWRGKLSDFGSANIVQYASTPGPGNRQYTAPEVLKEEKQTTKMDVYSYGKLLCEIFTNQFPDPIAFPSMMQSMARTWPLMHQIVISCVEHDLIKRPTMSSIVDQLTKINNDQDYCI